MKLAFDEIGADEYGEAVEAKRLGELLIERERDHEHLQAATIGYIFRDDELRRQGKVKWAEAILVERILQSERRWGRLVKWAILRILPQFGETLPAFIVLIDRNIWLGLSPEEKLALVDHELSHCAQAREDDGETPKYTRDGSPVWMIRSHDVEEFEAVIQRHGLWNDELRSLARTIITRLSTEAEDVEAVA